MKASLLRGSPAILVRRRPKFVEVMTEKVEDYPRQPPLGREN